MRFEPRPGGLEYTLLDTEKQIIVCSSADLPASPSTVAGEWGKRAAAYLVFHRENTEAFVRDLLYNPQIRAIVVLTPAKGWMHDRHIRDLTETWYGNKGLKHVPEHFLMVLRQFVDLYMEGCAIHTVLPTYWPVRIDDAILFKDQPTPT